MKSRGKFTTNYGGGWACKASPRHIAMHDIALDIDEEIGQGKLKSNSKDECWNVRPDQLLTKKTARLNKELGVHKINKYGEKMNRFKHD
jgi:hypothetical protein